MKKHLCFIPALTGGIIGALVFVLIGAHFLPVQYEVLLFTTVYSADENATTRDKEQSSTYFGETLIGWTRDPAFRSDVYERAGTMAEFYSRKQERQNLIIMVRSYIEEDAKHVAESVHDVLQEKIETFNSESKEFYGIQVSSSISNAVYPNQIVLSFLGFLFGGLLGLGFSSVRKR